MGWGISDGPALRSPEIRAGGLEDPMDKPVDGEMVRASIIAAHGQLFIRTTRKLYCVGKGR